MLYYSAMRQTLLILATVACAALTGCFDNHGRPQDATPVTSLAALAATNRAEVVRLYLRGGTEPLAKGALADLPRLRELDLSERALAAVPEEVFAAAGLVRYEVSNYAKPGFACRHNSAVWRGEDYVGLGEGAHGRLGLTRTVGTATGYETTAVTEREDAFERAVLGLRTAAGLDLADVTRRHPLLAPDLPAWHTRLMALVAPGILSVPTPRRFVPTARGFEVCDAVMAELALAEP